jgi:hypothetical protein
VSRREPSRSVLARKVGMNSENGRSIVCHASACVSKLLQGSRATRPCSQQQRAQGLSSALLPLETLEGNTLQSERAARTHARFRTRSPAPTHAVPARVCANDALVPQPIAIQPQAQALIGTQVEWGVKVLAPHTYETARVAGRHIASVGGSSSSSTPGSVAVTMAVAVTGGEGSGQAHLQDTRGACAAGAPWPSPSHSPEDEGWPSILSSVLAEHDAALTHATL